MGEKPVTTASVRDLINVVISDDPAEGAIIRLEIDGSTDVELVFNPLTLVKLQAVLSKADSVQRERQPTQ